MPVPRDADGCSELAPRLHVASARDHLVLRPKSDGEGARNVPPDALQLKLRRVGYLVLACVLPSLEGVELRVQAVLGDELSPLADDPGTASRRIDCTRPSAPSG